MNQAPNICTSTPTPLNPQAMQIDHESSLDALEASHIVSEADLGDFAVYGALLRKEAEPTSYKAVRAAEFCRSKLLSHQAIAFNGAVEVCLDFN